MSHAKPAASSGFQKAKVEELPKSQAHNASVGRSANQAGSPGA